MYNIKIYLLNTFTTVISTLVLFSEKKPFSPNYRTAQHVILTIFQGFVLDINFSWKFSLGGAL